MKKFFSLVLCVCAVLPLLLTGCSQTADETDTLSLGFGVYAVTGNEDATEDQNGTSKISLTFASVLVDENGKIVRCFLDAAEHTASFTPDGKAVDAPSFQTKYEQGDAYGMKIYGGAKGEWYEEADAFCALVEGKTMDDVKALVASDGKGTDEVIRAGCTISVSEFVMAIENAVKNIVKN